MAELLRIRGLTYQIDQTSLFDGLDLSLAAGDFVLLSGQTGSGKSSLLHLISGLIPASYRGEVAILGQPAHQLTQAQGLRLTGVLFQNPNRQFAMRTLRRELVFALENLGLPWEEMATRLDQACQVTRTSHLLDRSLSHLSGGEKQRAALCVLLAMDPPILLLDEPFASLDQTSRQDLISLLGNLAKQGKAVLLADHDLTGYDAVASHHYCLEAGRLVAQDLEDLPTRVSYKLSQSGIVKEVYLHLEQVSLERAGRLLWYGNSFALPKGITTLTGDNGVGKSSLLRAIAQLLPYRGRMVLEGRVLKRGRRLYETLSLTVQEALQQFVTLMPQEELAFSSRQWPDAKDWQERVIAATSLKGHQQVSLVNLSGGQQKLIQLMAMLSQDLSFLLLDEPFSGLDPIACALICEWIRSNQARYGQSFLVVSHRLEPLVGLSQHHIHLANQTLLHVEDGL